MTKPTWVRDGVAISDGLSARDFGQHYDHVITLSRSPDDRSDTGVLSDVGEHEHTTQYIPLWDSEQTSQDEFDRAVGATVKAIDTHDGDVLVHCQAGVSRSATVLITALAWIDDEPYDEIYDEVWSARPSVNPHPHLRDLALEFLDEDPKPSFDR